MTTPGNRGFVERLAKVPNTIRPDPLARDVGTNPHVTEAVIAYLPKQKAVFVSDLFTIPVAGPFPPASPALAVKPPAN